jgi:hypothetical protein
MEIMVTDPENLGARIGLDELKRRKAGRKQTVPAAEAGAPAAAPKAHASRRTPAAKTPTKNARATKPARATKTSKGKGEWNPICRYCGSKDLAPSFIKRHDARCRACFKKRYAGKYGVGAKPKRAKR